MVKDSEKTARAGVTKEEFQERIDTVISLVKNFSDSESGMTKDETLMFYEKIVQTILLMDVG